MTDVAKGCKPQTTLWEALRAHYNVSSTCLLKNASHNTCQQLLPWGRRSNSTCYLNNAFWSVAFIESYIIDCTLNNILKCPVHLPTNPINSVNAKNAE